MSGLEKNYVAMRISREMALIYGMVEPTPEEAAEMARNRAEYATERAEAAEEMTVAMMRLDELADPFARAALDLHAPNERHECSACWRGDEHADWPCETVDAIATVANIGLPDMSLREVSR